MVQGKNMQPGAILLAGFGLAYLEGLLVGCCEPSWRYSVWVLLKNILIQIVMIDLINKI